MRELKRGEYGHGLLIERDAGFVSPSDNTHLIKELAEAKNSPFDFKNPVLYGVMQKYGVENKNGRIYPEALLRREVETYMELIRMGASAGQTDHPESSVISIKETSMRISNLWWEGRNLMGEIYLPITRGYIEMGICSHPADKVIHDIINKFQYGVSSRGVGTLDSKNGKNIVQDDFELICWDFVTTPSTHGSWIFANKKMAEPFKESVDSKGYESEPAQESKFDVWDFMLKNKGNEQKERKQNKINTLFNNFMNKG